MRIGIAAVLLSMSALGASCASAATIVDPSFESPSVGLGGYQYDPASAPAGVTFDGGGAGGAGIQSNGSAWQLAAAPDGSQTAFLQSTGSYGASISLDVSDLTVGQSYRFSFYDALRNGPYNPNPVDVSFDGHDLGTYTPASTTWTQATTSSFVAGSTSGSLVFSAPSLAGDNDAGIDAVAINAVAVPEPATWAVMMLGLFGAGAMLRRRRQDSARAVAA